MECKIIGKRRPFYSGKLRKIGESINIPDEVMKSKDKPRWAEPVRAKTGGDKPK